MRILAFLLIFTILPFCSFAATWLRATNGQWYYIDAYLPSSFFLLETEAPEHHVINAISLPLEALKDQKEFSFELNKSERNFELLAVTDTSKTLVLNLSETGKAFFEQHPELIFYEAKKVAHILKEQADGSFELWDIETNEMIITLSQEGLEKYRNNANAVIMTLK